MSGPAFPRATIVTPANVSFIPKIAAIHSPSVFNENFMLKFSNEKF